MNAFRGLVITVLLALAGGLLMVAAVAVATSAK